MTTKKLTPASIVSQKKWSSFPVAKRNKLRKMLPDRDKDGVPNIFDCHPRNKRKQESFLPSDEAYIKSLKTVKLGEYIGEGENAQIYGVADNPDFIVKIPHYVAGVPYYADEDVTKLTVSERKEAMKYDLKELRDEARGYKDFDFSGKPIFIPTKVVRVQAHGITTFGLLRPKLTVIKDLTKKVPSAAKRLMTDSKLLKLYTDLVSLTHQGYAFHDGLQLGLDKAGRALVYDLGDTKRYPPSSNIPYNTNNTKWINLLEDLGKTPSEIAKYPEITR